MARSATKDVLEKFRFGISWGEADATDSLFSDDGSFKTDLVRAGFHDVQMPKRATNVVQYREGVDPDIYSKSAGLSTFEDLVMSRGLLADSTASREFWAWTQLVHKANEKNASFAFEAGGAAARPASGSQDYRKEVLIWMYDREGRVVRAWQLYNAFPVSFNSGSDLSAAEDGEKSLEQLTLAFEDFKELAIPSPTEDPPADDNQAPGVQG